MVMWLREQGCPLDSGVCNAAAEKETTNSEVVERARLSMG